MILFKVNKLVEQDQVKIIFFLIKLINIFLLQSNKAIEILSTNYKRKQLIDGFLIGKKLISISLQNGHHLELEDIDEIFEQDKFDLEGIINILNYIELVYIPKIAETQQTMNNVEDDPEDIELSDQDLDRVSKFKKDQIIVNFIIRILQFSQGNQYLWNKLQQIIQED